jgi:hypothetical protein
VPSINCSNPKPATSTDHAFAPAVTTEQDSTDEAKQKEKQKKLTELMLKEKELKELYEKTDDPEKKKMIKEKLVEIQQAKKNEGWVEENGPKIISEKEYEETTKKIKTMLETTEDPEKREQLKAKLHDLQEMKSKGLVKPTNIDYEKQALILKEMYEKEKDPEKKKMIKEKLAKLKELAAKEKEKKDGK